MACKLFPQTVPTDGAENRQ